MVVDVPLTEEERRKICIDLMIDIVKSCPSALPHFKLGIGKDIATILTSGAEDLEKYLWPEKKS